MNHPDDTGGEDGGSPNALFDCLADRDRRYLAGLLSRRAPDTVTRGELATALAARKYDSERQQVTDEERKRALTTLHHAHLPKLEAAGLIASADDGDAVAIRDHPAFRDPSIQEIVGGGTDADPESVDALFGALRAPRRRTTLDVLSHQFGPIHVETLSREVGARERDTTQAAVSVSDVEDVLASLYHNHLPCLSGAGLVEYDADEGTVAYAGHPLLRVPWMHSVLEPDFRTHLTGESEPREIWTIDGRERVVSFGQSLCDRVDEELFCMFTDTDLLEAGCLTRIRDASRRGVDVYLGTCDPTIREYVQENAPEVILWEPETNWLNLPAAEDRVGRLLLADREAVMLGTLKEETQDGDGFHEEQAVVGEGADNALVVMVTQLLDPYLGRIDDETEDVESVLPF